MAEIDAITQNSAEKVFVALAKSVKDSIEKNEPETGLDRLHTFVVKYMRVLCEKRGIAADREKPLHSLVGEYIKLLKGSNHGLCKEGRREVRATAYFVKRA